MRERSYKVYQMGEKLMAETTYFFAGANSGSGFRNLFGEILNPETAKDMIILKGGPGTGKNTFMHKIGSTMEKAGAAVEYLCCSGDPDSLDGVVIPQINCAAADGTSPHELEPRYPAAVDRIVDLGQFCDIDGIKQHTEKIRQLNKKAKACSNLANRCLRTAYCMEKAACETVNETFDADEAFRWGNEIIQREIPRTDRPAGRTKRRFLGSITRKGYVWRFDTVETLCGRVYELCDRWGQGGVVLKQLHFAAAERGWDTVLCPSAETPEMPEHLLIPELGLAFVTSRPQMKYPGKAASKLDIDSFSHPAEKEKLCFWEKTAETLRREGADTLKISGNIHDELEKIYNPYVDFEKVQALAEREAERLLGWLSEQKSCQPLPRK